jgi:proton glutamate symport protein
MVRPGVGVSLGATAKSVETVAAPPTGSELLERTVPQSFFESAARNDGLQVVVFAVLFGVALTQVKGKPRETMTNFFEGVSEVMFKFTGLVMKLAPFGIGAAMAVAVGHAGFFEVLRVFGRLVFTLYGAVLVFVLAVLLPVALLARIPILRFLNRIKQPIMIAFSTTSSEAALPSAMEELVRFGVPKRIVSFVLPAGYSFNLDGTTLYLSVALVFIAQAAGVPMTVGQQCLAMLTLMLTSKGAAGVPRAALVVLSGTLAVFNLPIEGVALLLSVDLIMDMARTTLNLVGNCLAGAVVARWEGELRVINLSGQIETEAVK